MSAAQRYAVDAVVAALIAIAEAATGDRLVSHLFVVLATLALLLMARCVVRDERRRR